ncbi:MAG: hypothetical protein V1725_04625 [archaeon]
MKALALLLVVLAISFVACTSNQPSAPEQVVPEQTTPQEQVPPAPQPVAPEQPQADVNAPAEDQTPAEEQQNTDFSGYFAAFPAVAYKVTYDVVTAGMSSVMTQAIKDGQMKMTTETSEGEALTFFIDGKLYSCTAVSEDMLCFELEQGDTSAISRNDDLKENWQSYNVVEKPGKTIAGVQTTCFELTQENAVVEYCYSPDYVPLYIKSTAQDVTSEMTAREYTTNVDDSEFVLPAEPGAMPDIPNIPGYT